MEQWRRIEKERQRSGDAIGITSGVDRIATLRLYNGVDAMRQGIIRRITLGSIWTRSKLVHTPRAAMVEVLRATRAFKP